MEQNKKIFKEDEMLQEAESLLFLGGSEDTDVRGDFTINFGRGCRSWGDCRKICGLMPAPAPGPLPPLSPLPW